MCLLRSCNGCHVIIWKWIQPTDRRTKHKPMKIRNVKKEINGFTLNIQELKLEQGIIYGLVGRTGSGKTTLLKVLAGILKPDSGELDFEGLASRQITMVPDKPYLLFDTVYQNVIYPLKIRKEEPDREVVDRYLELAGLKNMRNQYAPALSSRDRQKLGLVRALIFSPKLFLVEEMFSSGDLQEEEALGQLILEYQSRTSSTWVLVSRQVSSIERMCSHVVSLSGGMVEWEGDVGR